MDVAEDEAIDGAVLIRTGRRARNGRALTRVPVEDGGADRVHADGDGDGGGETEILGVDTSVDTRLLRERLYRLHELATDELQRRRIAAELEPAHAAPVPIKEPSSISRL